MIGILLGLYGDCGRLFAGVELVCNLWLDRSK